MKKSIISCIALSMTLGIFSCQEEVSLSEEQASIVQEINTKPSTVSSGKLSLDELAAFNGSHVVKPCNGPKNDNVSLFLSLGEGGSLRLFEFDSEPAFEFLQVVGKTVRLSTPTYTIVGRLVKGQPTLNINYKGRKYCN